MENKTFIDFLIETSERHGYDARWMKTGEESDLGIFKCYQEAADLYAENEKKSHGYQLHQKIFTVAYDLWRILQRKTNTNREVFSEIDIKRIENNKAILDKNTPPFDPKNILRQS